MKANNVIDGGRPILCPLICAFWLFAYRVKSGIFNDKVAQKPTTAVKPGKKNLKNSADELYFDGCSKIGPRPFAAVMAHANNPSAASGRKIALNTKSFLMLS